jgi:hypothetical protein
MVLSYNLNGFTADRSSAPREGRVTNDIRR